MPNYSVDLIVPVYKNKNLTQRCLETLTENVAEIADYQPRLLLVNDSPDDEEVTGYLASFEQANPAVVLLTNPRNIGFVKSVNKALERTRAEGRAAILINSDTETFPGTLKNLLAAADTDPQIGFACPRSNNAALSTFPQLPHNQGGSALSPQQTHQVWQQLSSWLPKVTYAPTAVGFYLYIKKEVVLNFGVLDETFGMGYEEENDLVMRANKVGYRAVLANHAFAYHAGSASFLLQDIDVSERKSANLRKLMERHAEFLPLVRRFESSPEVRAERLLKNLVPSRDGRLRLLVDSSRMGPHTNGTSELTVNAIRSIVLKHGAHYDVSVLCSKETFAFHKLDQLPGLERVDSVTSDYAVAINMGQPFDLHQINVLETAALVNVYGMLDTIAQDCGHLTIGNEVDRYWKYVADHANGVFFISDFSRQIFFNRFPRSRADFYAKLLPTRRAMYQAQYEGVSTGERHVLVMGNHFPHKASEAVGEALAAGLGNASVVTLGAGRPQRGNLANLQSGTIDDATMNNLFAKASVVVLPSYYEGFGFGLAHALAIGKPVVARDIPATREILATFKQVKGVFLFDDEKDIVRLVKEAADAGRSEVDDSATMTWDDWVSGLLALCDKLLASRSLYGKCVERIAAGDALRETAELRSRLHVASGAGASQSASSSAAPAPTDATAAAYAEIRSVDDLVRLDGDAFVRAAYQRILRRPADPGGLNYYTERVRNGVPKQDIVADLAVSQEGRKAAVDFPGLQQAIKSASRRKFRRMLGLH